MIPAPAARIPALSVRVALVILGAALSVVEFGLGGWMAVGILFTVLAAWEPRAMLSWLLIIFFVLGRISQHDTLSWQLLVMIAGLHLLAVLSSLALELPWRSRVTPAVVTVPLVRFALIQIPCQLLAVAALLVLAPGSGGQRPVTVAVIAVLGVAALLGLALLLLAPRSETS